MLLGPPPPVAVPPPVADVPSSTEILGSDTTAVTAVEGSNDWVGKFNYSPKVAVLTSPEYLANSAGKVSTNCMEAVENREADSGLAVIDVLPYPNIPLIPVAPPPKTVVSKLSTNWPGNDLLPAPPNTPSSNPPVLAV